MKPTPFIPDKEGVFYGLPAAEYHAAPGVSQSTLKAFAEAATPAHFKAAKPKEPTPDMEFGTVCHAAILEPWNLFKCCVVHPAEYPDDKGKMKPWHNGAKFCEKWNAEHAAQIIIDQEQADKLPKIVQSVTRHAEFAGALESGQREVSFFKRDEETGLMLKCRTDLIAQADGGLTYIFDPKKVRSGEATAKGFQSSVLDYGYHIQAASYLHITGASRFIFVPFEDSEPFGSIQYQLEDYWLDQGLRHWRQILNRYAWCVQNDSWPSYPAGILSLECPKWAQRKLEEAA